MADNEHILRLAYHDRANMLPLLYPLAAGWTQPESPWKVEMAPLAPAAALNALLAGEVDAAFVSPVAAQVHGSAIAPLGGWGIATHGAAETTLLLAPQRLDHMDGAAVAVTPEAAGSVVETLLKTLLTPYYGISLELRREGEDGYAPSGPRLVYGDDPDARKLGGEWVAEDLGLAWWVLTGLPMVWDLLCSRRDLEASKPGAGQVFTGLLKQSQRTATDHASSVQDQAARRLGLPAARIKELFARQRYTLGQDEQRGLAHFLDQAGRARAI
jgi:predicted solute-binding protein